MSNNNNNMLSTYYYYISCVCVCVYPPPPLRRLGRALEGNGGSGDSGCRHCKVLRGRTRPLTWKGWVREVEGG